MNAPPASRIVPAGARMLAAVLATAALLLGPAAAVRAQDDRNQPLNIEADAGRYDDQKRTGTFTGHVVLTKGSMQMRAARVEVHQGPDGFQHGVATAAPGGRATFSQQREGTQQTIEGEAERIEYDGKADTIRLVGHAVLRRLQDGKVTDQATGGVITWDNRSQVFSVSGGSDGATPGNPGGRVRAVITPRESPASGAPASGAGR